MSRIHLLVAAALLACSLPLSAGEPVQKVYGVAEFVVPCGHAGTEACDLPACCAEAGLWAAHLAAPKKTEEDKLIKLITTTVRPLCWASNGGQCSIEYFPIGMGLVVHAPEDVQKEVSDLLDSLRKRQDEQISFTLRFVTVSECFAERLNMDFGKCAGCEPGKTVCTIGKDGLERVGCDFDCPGCCPDCCERGCGDAACGRSLVLSEEQVWLFLEAVQGDRRANVMNAPRLTLLDGQVGTFCSQDRQQYVTGVHIKVVDGKQRVEPEVTSHPTGLKATLCGKIAADRKHVVVSLDMNYCCREGADVPLMPVTYVIEPQFEGGVKGPPVPFTQFIQQPKFQTLSVDSHFNMPIGGTMLIDAGKFLAVERVEYGVPVLSRIPYVNRLFKHAKTVKECDHLLVLVTPTVQTEPCDAACCPPCPSCPAPCDPCKACPAGCGSRVVAAAARCGHEVAMGGLVYPAEKACAAIKPCVAPSAPVAAGVESRTARVAAKLVQKYHEACASGQHEQAREFAQMALDLDPGCFAKPFATCVPAAPSVPMTPVTMPGLRAPAMPEPAPPDFGPMPEPTQQSNGHSQRTWRQNAKDLGLGPWAVDTLAGGTYMEGIDQVPQSMSRAIQEDLNRRLPPRFATPPASQR